MSLYITIDLRILKTIAFLGFAAIRFLSLLAMIIAGGVLIQCKDAFLDGIAIHNVGYMCLSAGIVLFVDIILLFNKFIK